MGKIRTALVLIAAAAPLAGTTLVTAPASASARPSVTVPKITVTPSTGLRKGQVVTVKGSGFRAKDSVYVVECLVGASGGSQCNLNTLKAATISSAGVLAPTKFKVVTGKVGTGKCGTTTANLAKCDISVGNVSGGDSAVKKIKFAAPK